MIDTTPTPEPEASRVKPRWRKIAEFPLIALLLALVSLIAAMAGTGYLLALAAATSAGGLPKWLLMMAFSIVEIAVVVAVYKLWVARLGEHPRDELPFDRRFADLGKGTLIAVLLMSAVVGVAAALGGYRIADWGGSTSFAFFLFQAGIQAAIVEEILIRGILFRWLEELGGSWFALAVSSALFGFGHAMNPNATVLTSLAIALEAGVLLGGAYMLTRNLWLAVGIHFGWNFTQGYLWDVPVSGFDGDGLLAAQPAGHPLVSGGAFGLEASLPALVLATALGVWFVVQAARRGHVVRPWWVRRRLARDTAPA